MTVITNSTRIYSMDALRALAMFLGIALHAAMPFTDVPFKVLSHDPYYSNVTFDLIFFFIHIFRMQLFYVIAGFFFRLLYLKIGTSAFIKHRVQRILLPFVVGLFTILPLTFLPFSFNRITDGGAHLTGQDVQAIIRDVFSWHGPIHLWFLYYLMIFYIAGLLLRQWCWPVIAARPRLAQLVMLKISPALLPLLLIFLCFLTLLPFESAFVQLVPSLKPSLPFLLYYGVFFYAGWVLHSNMYAYFDLLRRYCVFFSIAGVALAAILGYAEHIAHIGGIPLWLTKMVTACTTMSLVLGISGIFLRWVNAESPRIRYLSDSSYWIYLVHMGLLSAAQLWIGNTHLWGPLKYISVITFTTVIGLVTYQWLVRYTFIGYYLHGVRKRP